MLRRYERLVTQYNNDGVGTAPTCTYSCSNTCADSILIFGIHDDVATETGRRRKYGFLIMPDDKINIFSTGTSCRE